MARADAFGNVEGYSRDGIEWDVEQLETYFENCQRKYEDFLAMSDTLARNFQTVVDDPDHTGQEAAATKSFSENVQIKLIEDIAELSQKTEEIQNKLMNDFANEIDSSQIAVLKSVWLKNIIDIFENSYETFVCHSNRITEIANGLASECSEVGHFDVPNPEDTKNVWKEFTEPGTGYLPVLVRKFEEFDCTHSADIANSAVSAMCEKIEYNFTRLLNMSDQCLSLDISTFCETDNSLALADPEDAFSGEDHDKYEQDISAMKEYLHGVKEDCLLTKYDPVDLCSGNFISEQDDLTIGGAYPLTFHRFYNALQKEAGKEGKSGTERQSDIGIGWCHNFSMHVTRENDDYIKISYPDGSIGTYIRRDGIVLHLEGEPFEPEVWIEEHGEQGELTVYADGYRITTDRDNYIAFDQNGYVISMGDAGKGEKISISYELNGIDKQFPGNQADNRRILRVKAKSGAFIRFTYTADNMISSIIDHTGRAVSYTYNAEKCLTDIFFADGANRHYDYDGEGRIVRSRNEAGVTAIANRYDEQNRIIGQTYPNTGTMSYEYDDRKKHCIVTERNGNKVTYVHDEKGRHVGTKYYDGEEKYRYNEQNKKISYTDKNGNTTRYTYDNKGHLTGVFSAGGSKLFMTYNAQGKLSVVKGANDAAWHYRYTSEGYPSEITDPLGNTTTMYYENGKLTGFRDAENNYSAFTYDAADNVESYTDAGGIITYYTYDALGRIVETSDAEGNATQYAYDEADRLITLTDAMGSEAHYVYEASGKIAVIINPDGTKTQWQYDVNGKPGVYIDEAGRVTSTRYNIMDEEEEITLSDGGCIRYEYDPLMRVTGITDPEGRKISYTYDSAGNVLTVENAEGMVAKYVYDSDDRLIEEYDAEKRLTRTVYNEDGLPIEDIDAEGGTTRYQYDVLGRLTSATDQLGAQTSYTYTALGKIATVTQADGRKTEYRYRKGGILSAVYEGDMLQESYDYDRLGRISTKTLEDGYQITYQYDAVGRVTEAAATDGKLIKYQYDAMSRLISMTDCGNTTKYSYTRTGKLARVIDALGTVTSYEYDQADRLVKTETAENCMDAVHLTDSLNAVNIDQCGHVTLYEYNLAGDLTAVTDALGQKETYTYNNIGRMIAKTDRDGNRTDYEYNRLGLIRGIHYADGRKLTAGYDQLNHLNHLNDWLGETGIENDALGRVLRVKDYKNQTVTYSYGICGEQKSITYPDGHTVHYDYDENLQLRKLTDGDHVTDYQYDGLGRLIQKSFPNGTGTDYAYYQGGLLKSLINRDREGILDHFEYRYDESGNRTYANRQRRGMEEISGEYCYQYDPLGRLTNVQHGQDPARTYQYDGYNNRICMQSGNQKISYYYDALDRLMHTKEQKPEVPARVFDYSYDKRGNLTGISANGQMQKRYTYDAINKLTAAENKENDTLANYAYNGMGIRVSMESAHQQISYLCDMTREYHNLLERTVNGEKETFVSDGTIVSMRKGTSDYYYLKDEMGSPAYLTGTDGAPVSAYAYDEFGQYVAPFQGPQGRRYWRQGNIIQPFAFTGYQQDDISELNFAQARYYDAGTGRFAGEDNIRGFIESPITMNHYAYCFSNPLKYVDLNGNWPNIVKNIQNAVVNVETKIDNSAVGQWASKHKELVGGAIVVGGMVAGAVAGAAVTAAVSTVAGPLAGKVVGGAIGGAISGAVSDIGVQYMTNGSFAKTNYKEVGVWTAAGAVEGGFGGAITSGVSGLKKIPLKIMSRKAAVSALINGTASFASDSVNGEKLSALHAIETAGFSAGFSFLGDIAGNLFKGISGRVNNVVGEDAVKISSNEGQISSMESSRSGIQAKQTRIGYYHPESWKWTKLEREISKITAKIRGLSEDITSLTKHMNRWEKMGKWINILSSDIACGSFFNSAKQELIVAATSIKC